MILFEFNERVESIAGLLEKFDNDYNDFRVHCESLRVTEVACEDEKVMSSVVKGPFNGKLCGRLEDICAHIGDLNDVLDEDLSSGFRCMVHEYTPPVINGDPPEAEPETRPPLQLILSCIDSELDLFEVRLRQVMKLFDGFTLQQKDKVAYTDPIHVLDVDGGCYYSEHLNEIIRQLNTVYVEFNRFLDNLIDGRHDGQVE